MNTRLSLLSIILLIFLGLECFSKEVVVFNPLKGYGTTAEDLALMNDIIQAELSNSETITLVDRTQLDKILKELQISQQGMVNAETAKHLGKVFGAKYFCSGSINKSGDKQIAVARVIDVETTVIKISYADFQNKEGVTEAGKKLASGIEKLVSQLAADKKENVKEAIEKKIPENWRRPSVMVIIPEMHVRHPVLIDPAAETAVIRFLIANKFKVFDSEYVVMMKNDPSNTEGMFKSKKTAAEYALKKGAEILIYGEAISEQGAKLGEFEGCRGRVELKAINTKDGEILLSDSAEDGAADLSETIAGKKAIEKAVVRLSGSFFFSLLEKLNK
ncbi:MAG: CsgG/HfaB family protein [Victivallales bacterium]